MISNQGNADLDPEFSKTEHKHVWCRLLDGLYYGIPKPLAHLRKGVPPSPVTLRSPQG